MSNLGQLLVSNRKSQSVPDGTLERNHYHCPISCEHPQPFITGELLLCGRCYFVDDQITPMVECECNG